jgi:Tfp pilus assembly protein PilN
MIEINLLPGARKAKRSAGASVDMGEMFSGALTQVKDPFLIMAVVGLVIGGLAFGAQYVLLGQRAGVVEERQNVAVQDSTRYAAILAERMLVMAQRDSVVRQFSIIKAIDGERFTWPHVLSELSRELPDYTWIINVHQTSPVISVVETDSAPPAPRARNNQQDVEQLANAAAASVPKMTFRVVGQTVDIQALTRYMRLLEASPFIENVALVTSDSKATEGGDVTEFTIDMQFQTPVPSAIRTVPLTIAVR